MIKKKFEKEILDRLGVKWKRKRWWQLRVVYHLIL